MTAADDVLRRLDDNASAHQWPGAEPLLRDAAALIREQRLRIRELESWRATVLDRAERAEAELAAAKQDICQSDERAARIAGYLDQAEAERDAAIKDARRYRWMREGFIRYADNFLHTDKELLILGGVIYRWRTGTAHRKQ